MRVDLLNMFDMLSNILSCELKVDLYRRRVVKIVDIVRWGTEPETRFGLVTQFSKKICICFRSYRWNIRENVSSHIQTLRNALKINSATPHFLNTFLLVWICDGDRMEWRTSPVEFWKPGEIINVERRSRLMLYY